MLKVRVRYCGGCNPEIDRVGLVEELQQELARVSIKAKLVRQDEENPDLVLLVNGCRHACLNENPAPREHTQLTISVKGKMVEDQNVREADMPHFIARTISRIFSRMPHIVKEGKNEEGSSLNRKNTTRSSI